MRRLVALQNIGVFTSMDDILVRVNLESLGDRFREEKIEPEMIEGMRDEELMRLGVSAIGDRIRLRNICKKIVEEEAATTSGNSGDASAGSQSLASRALQERMSLMGSRTGRRGQKRKANDRPRTWTAHFICLADRFQTKIPTSTEKQALHKAGLGLKKIKLEVTDDEAAVCRKITSDEVDENGQTIGFPQLRDCGGFEMLHCVSNCKDLKLITCSWSTNDLKANIGGQSKMYLRPIQRSLSTRSQLTENKSQVKEKCISCHNEFLIRDLRQHTFLCRARNAQSSDSEPEQELLRSPFETNQRINSAPQDASVEERRDAPVENQPNIRENFVSSPEASDQQQNVAAVQPETTSIPPQPQQRVELSQPEVIDVEDDDSTRTDPISLDDLIQQVALYCKENNVSDPVEILKCLQKEVVTGRPLEVVDVGQCVQGVTNFILVDRDNLLATAFEELTSHDDLRPTLEVQFYGEEAEDYGGPRKEFFRLALTKIQEKYFDNGIREHLSDDYYKIGLIMGLSILQNGKIPQFLSEGMLEEIFQQTTCTSPSLSCLQNGLRKTGILQICKSMPIFRHLFRPSQASALTLKKLTNLLKPDFSETGSNKRRFENDVYSALCKYLREAASGRRGAVTLAHVLQFVTGADEEPLLGFALHPSLHFVVAESSFLPVASTCINSLKLPCASPQQPLPDRDRLFELYDLAFTNTYFGSA